MPKMYYGVSVPSTEGYLGSRMDGLVIKTPGFPSKTNHWAMIGVLLYEPHRRIFWEYVVVWIPQKDIWRVCRKDSRISSKNKPSTNDWCFVVWIPQKDIWGVGRMFGVWSNRKVFDRPTDKSISHSFPVSRIFPHPQTIQWYILLFVEYLFIEGQGTPTPIVE